MVALEAMEGIDRDEQRRSCAAPRPMLSLGRQHVVDPRHWASARHQLDSRHLAAPDRTGRSAGGRRPRTVEGRRSSPASLGCRSVSCCSRAERAGRRDRVVVRWPPGATVPDDDDPPRQADREDHTRPDGHHCRPTRSDSQPCTSAPSGYSAPRMNVFTANTRPRMSSLAACWLSPANVVNDKP